MEIRSITAIPLVNGDSYLYGAKQALRIVRARKNIKTGAFSAEVVYCITSAASDKYTPEQLLEFNRNHWSIEVSHYIRDNTFFEDRSTNKQGATFMAALRAFAIGLFHFLGFREIATATRQLRYSLSS
jgi:hypothetical protein